MGVETSDKGCQQSPAWTLLGEMQLVSSLCLTKETFGLLQEYNFTSFGSIVSAGSKIKQWHWCWHRVFIAGARHLQQLLVSVIALVMLKALNCDQFWGSSHVCLWNLSACRNIKRSSYLPSEHWQSGRCCWRCCRLLCLPARLAGALAHPVAVCIWDPGHSRECRRHTVLQRPSWWRSRPQTPESAWALVHRWDTPWMAWSAAPGLTEPAAGGAAPRR